MALTACVSLRSHVTARSCSRPAPRGEDSGTSTLKSSQPLSFPYPSTSSHLLPYRKNPFIGSLRHAVACRGLFDLLPPDAQRKHAALCGDDSLSPVKRVPVLTRSQFLQRKAKLAALSKQQPSPVPSASPESTAAATPIDAPTTPYTASVGCSSMMESWAAQMGQMLWSREQTA